MSLSYYPIATNNQWKSQSLVDIPKNMHQDTVFGSAFCNHCWSYILWNCKHYKDHAKLCGNINLYLVIWICIQSHSKTSFDVRLIVWNRQFKPKWSIMANCSCDAYTVWPRDLHDVVMDLTMCCTLLFVAWSGLEADCSNSSGITWLRDFQNHIQISGSCMPLPLSQMIFVMKTIDEEPTQHPAS